MAETILDAVLEFELVLDADGIVTEVELILKLDLDSAVELNKKSKKKVFKK